MWLIKIMRNTFIRPGVDGPTIPSVVYHINDLKLPGPVMLGRVGDLRVKRGAVNDYGMYKRRISVDNNPSVDLGNQSVGGYVSVGGDASVDDVDFSPVKKEMNYSRGENIDFLPVKKEMNYSRGENIDFLPVQEESIDIEMGPIDLADQLNYTEQLLIESRKDKSNDLEIIKKLKHEKLQLDKVLSDSSVLGKRKPENDVNDISDLSNVKKFKKGNGKVYEQVQKIEKMLEKEIKQKEIAYKDISKKEPPVLKESTSKQLAEKDEIKRIIRILKLSKNMTKTKKLQILNLENRLRSFEKKNKKK
jgi:hypothetical protein